MRFTSIIFTAIMAVCAIGVPVEQATAEVAAVVASAAPAEVAGRDGDHDGRRNHDGNWGGGRDGRHHDGGHDGDRDGRHHDSGRDGGRDGRNHHDGGRDGRHYYQLQMGS